MYYKWDKTRAEDHIDSLSAAVEEVTIKVYTKEKSLSKIKVNEAYEMNAVHMYVDILNLQGLLTTVNGTESSTTHKRAIRFFDSHVRAIKFILDRTDSLFVDFHNQRLHAVIAKPYGVESERARVEKAIAIADLIIESVNQKREINGDEAIEPAEIRIGIDSGISLAVNNGRKSNKEPLFLGDPANHAAKHACGEKIGIYLTNNARDIIGLTEAADSKKVKLKSDEIQTCKDAADLDLTSDDVMKELENHDKKLSDFSFSRTTPPLKDLEFDDLYYKSAKHQQIVSIYADIDGFTNFVSTNMDSNESKANIVRALHVLRSEMDDSLSRDYKGRRVRFIGDCLHGLICEGSHKDTDSNKSVDVATEAVAGIRSSFNMCLEKLKESFDIDGLNNLGLAIGYEIGDVSLTRIGKRDNTSRYAIGISTIESEEAQKVCKGNATKIGDEAFKHLSEKYDALFSNQIAKDLTFASIKKAEQDSEDKGKVKKHSLYETTPHVKTELKAHAKN
ncbi:adenylate and Guanylate cyclase catalytic domain protein [Acinetobacter sp. 1542444]|uniref:adenylate/guanylate cyclase domain-containing protein n=1 Tax=Acinetobacter sp. 1542444 TaxID=1310681 RepID=UPI0004498283|nr:adenylate/guanylate cyclase domain-containing protein [Acinetobacter sp. 1542444]EXE61474.1 adenylate and Guanylate cyclase catalytic domain protein [Acinetobacter sp. 1542444]